jgi:hypothetical protein
MFLQTNVLYKPTLTYTVNFTNFFNLIFVGFLQIGTTVRKAVWPLCSLAWFKGTSQLTAKSTTQESKVYIY